MHRPMKSTTFGWRRDCIMRLSLTSAASSSTPTVPPLPSSAAAAAAGNSGDNPATCSTFTATAVPCQSARYTVPNPPAPTRPDHVRSPGATTASEGSTSSACSWRCSDAARASAAPNRATSTDRWRPVALAVPPPRPPPRASAPTPSSTPSPLPSSIPSALRPGRRCCFRRRWWRWREVPVRASTRVRVSAARVKSESWPAQT
mmetsp:Transcript_26118/g.84062  ORF Transcript_26118/g.84062 Transcript_26118/m.84062 type:complete len:203 (-) Transcript_26118:722-1330(-)